MSALRIRRVLRVIVAAVQGCTSAAASSCLQAARVIQRAAGRLPGAAVILPLAAGSLSTSLAPSALRLGPFTRGLTGDGATCMIGLLLVCVGAQISPATARAVGGRIGLMFAATTGITGAAAIVLIRLAPHGLAGVTPQALVVAATCTSPALWLALAGRYGSGSDRWAGMVVSTLNSCAAVPMLLLAFAGGRAGTVSLRGLADAVLPLLIGLAVGRIPGAAVSAGRAISPLLLAVSFGLGCQIQLTGLGGVWLPGAVLGVAVAVVKGGLVAGAWRLVLRQPATVGWAAGACTVAAPLVPQLMAAASPALAGGRVAESRGELAVAVVVSTVAAPVLTVLANRVHRANHRTELPAAASGGDNSFHATTSRVTTPEITAPGAAEAEAAAGVQP
jgi:hypothetical protein